MSIGQLRGLQDRRLLVTVHRGVYRLAGASPSWRQRAMAAHLAYGAPCAVSYRAAARIWGFEGILAEDPEITVPPWRDGSRAGILTHRALLPDSDVTLRYGIPVTTPCRTLVDLARVTSTYLLERAVDHTLRSSLVGAEQLAGYARATRGGGHVGIAALCELLRYRVEHPGIGDSEWADRVYGWIVDSGLEAPLRQVQVTLGGTVWILDMAYPDRKIAIEFDGYDYHGRRHRFDSDAARYDELVLAGWTVLRVTSKHGRDRVVSWVARALAGAGPPAPTEPRPPRSESPPAPHVPSRECPPTSSLPAACGISSPTTRPYERGSWP